MTRMIMRMRMHRSISMKIMAMKERSTLSKRSTQKKLFHYPRWA